MPFPKDPFLNYLGSRIKRLGLSIPALIAIQLSQIDHYKKCLRVLLTRDATAKSEGLQVQRLGQSVLTFKVIQGRMIAHTSQGRFAAVAQNAPLGRYKGVEQGLGRVILSFPSISRGRDWRGFAKS